MSKFNASMHRLAAAQEDLQVKDYVLQFYHGLITIEEVEAGIQRLLDASFQRGYEAGTENGWEQHKYHNCVL